MILIKLGGSVITDKDTPLSFRNDSVEALGGAISDIMETEPVMAVHGGGSFGHHYSVIHDMHTAPDTYDARGLAVVKNSMVKLHSMVLDSLAKSGVSAYGCCPSAFMRGHDMSDAGAGQMAHAAGCGLCPVTYGDALWCGSRDGRPLSYILSGDRIMGLLARVLRPRLVVFAVNIDGLYTSPGSGRLVERYGYDTPDMPTGEGDVTGGMARKVGEAVSISKQGMGVFFVNGNRPERIVSAVQDGQYRGTVFGDVP